MCSPTHVCLEKRILHKALHSPGKTGMLEFRIQYPDAWYNCLVKNLALNFVDLEITLNVSPVSIMDIKEPLRTIITLAVTTYNANIRLVSLP